jgi:VanZ family protein
VLLSAWRRVPESCNEQTKGRVDWLGATWATFGLGGLVFGLIKSNARLD